MKTALLVLAVVLAGCSINHRSGDFACVKNSDCSTGRVCDNGFCIVSGSIDAPRNDAPKGSGGDAQGCPTGCTSCNMSQKTCTIDCSLPGSNCNNQVTCPTGYKCDVQCKTDSSCRSGVNCDGASQCTVECGGRNSCRNVQCGPARCDIMCSGQSSCQDTIRCNNSCACDVTCTGVGACQNFPSCTSAACTTVGGCTSVPANCNSC